MTTRPRVYLAHSVITYGTDLETDALDCLAGLLPGVELVNPAGRYLTSTGWLRGWPRLVPTLAGLVVLPDWWKMIGTGCWREVGAAIAASVPVAVLDAQRLHLAIKPSLRFRG